MSVVGQEWVLGLELQELVAAFGDDDGFGDAVLHTATVGVDEELGEAGAELEGGCAVAEGALDGVPQGQVAVHEGDYADLDDALAGVRPLPVQSRRPK